MPEQKLESVSSNDEMPVRPRIPYAASILRRQPTPMSDDLLRTRALIRWRTIIESDITTSVVGAQAEHAIINGSSNYSVNDVLTDIFSRKSTASLIKRSGDLIRYNM